MGFIVLRYIMLKGIIVLRYIMLMGIIIVRYIMLMGIIIVRYIMLMDIIVLRYRYHNYVERLGLEFFATFGITGFLDLSIQF